MKSIVAGIVTLAVLLSACAGQQQPPAPPPLKIVAEAPTDSRATPPPPTGAQLLAEQPAEVQAAIKEQGGLSAADHSRLKAIFGGDFKVATEAGQEALSKLLGAALKTLRAQASRLPATNPTGADRASAADPRSGAIHGRA